jgi:plasmid stabilization system protein ParE
VKYRFTERARRQARDEDAWWRENRDRAPDLLADELERALETLLILPVSGKLYGVHDGVPLRRVPLKKTRCHLYYSVEDDEIVIHFVWGARKRTGPPLASSGH